jgi:hypothetical protein
VYLFLADGTRLGEMRGPPGQAFGGLEGVAVDDDGNLFVLELESRPRGLPGRPSVLRLRIPF